jgi:hypothetical protein
MSSQPVIFQLASLIESDEECKLWSFLLRNFRNRDVASLVDQHVLFSSLCHKKIISGIILFGTVRELCWNKERIWDCLVPHCWVHMTRISTRVQLVARLCVLYSRVVLFWLGCRGSVQCWACCRVLLQPWLKTMHPVWERLQYLNYQHVHCLLLWACDNSVFFIY